MSGIRKLKAVRAIVRPDMRDAYLESWKDYARSAKVAGAKVFLFEDQVLPGRFLEFSEHIAAKGMEGALEAAIATAQLRQCCVRRDGDDVLYREVSVEQ